MKVNDYGVLYYANYYCDPDYALLVAGRRKQTNERICNPKIDLLFKNNKVVKRNQFSGEAPICKSTNNIFFNN